MINKKREGGYNQLPSCLVWMIHWHGPASIERKWFSEKNEVNFKRLN